MKTLPAPTVIASPAASGTVGPSEGAGNWRFPSAGSPTTHASTNAMKRVMAPPSAATRRRRGEDFARDRLAPGNAAHRVVEGAVVTIAEGERGSAHRHACHLRRIPRRGRHRRPKRLVERARVDGVAGLLDV